MTEATSQETRLFTIDFSEIRNLTQAAEHIIKCAEGRKVWFFEGEMGSGKTTIIAEIMKCLKSKDHVSSPTFSIVNEYIIPENKSVFHFDLFRLKNTEELMDLGFEDYLSDAELVLIEWPGLAEPFIDEDIYKISLSVNNMRRTLKTS